MVKREKKNGDVKLCSFQMLFKEQSIKSIKGGGKIDLFGVRDVLQDVEVNNKQRASPDLFSYFLLLLL